jgi:flagellar brake protein
VRPGTELKRDSIMVDDKTRSEHLIELYRQLSDDSDIMLAHARNGDWDTVSKIQESIATQFRQLVDDNSAATLSAEHRKVRVGLLKRVIENDAQIRNLAMPAMGRMETMLKSANRSIQQPEPNIEILSNFDITSRVECLAILEKLRADGSLLSVCSLDDPSEVIVTQLLSIDAKSGRIAFELSHVDAHTNFIARHRKAIVVAIEEKIKLQFIATEIELGQDERTPLLLADFPESIYRIQRREAFRVRPLATHPATCLMPMQARRHVLPDNQSASAAPALFDALVLDVSVGGLSLELLDFNKDFELGDILEDCFLHLPGQTAFRCTLKLCYIGTPHLKARSYRIGAHFEDLSSESERAIQRYVNAVEISRKSVKPASP